MGPNIIPVTVISVLFVVEPFQGPSYAVSLAWDGSRYLLDWETMVAHGTID